MHSFPFKCMYVYTILLGYREDFLGIFCLLFNCFKLFKVRGISVFVKGSLHTFGNGYWIMLVMGILFTIAKST